MFDTVGHLSLCRRYVGKLYKTCDNKIEFVSEFFFQAELFLIACGLSAGFSPTVSYYLNQHDGGFNKVINIGV